MYLLNQLESQVSEEFIDAVAFCSGKQGKGLYAQACGSLKLHVQVHSTPRGLEGGMLATGSASEGGLDGHTLLVPIALSSGGRGLARGGQSRVWSSARPRAGPGLGAHRSSPPQHGGGFTLGP